SIRSERNCTTPITIENRPASRGPSTRKTISVPRIPSAADVYTPTAVVTRRRLRPSGTLTRSEPRGAEEPPVAAQDERGDRPAVLERGHEREGRARYVPPLRQE